MHGRISLHASIAASPHPKPKHDDRKIKNKMTERLQLLHIFSQVKVCGKGQKPKNMKSLQHKK